MVTDVALVPLSSQSEAENGLVGAIRHRETTGDTDEDSSDAESTVDESNDVHSATDAQEAPSPADDVRTKPEKDDATATTSIAEDVFARRGPYGQFASQWLTKKGWGLPGMRAPSKTAEVVPERSQTGNVSSSQQSPATSMKDAISSPPMEGSSSERGPGSTSLGEPKPETSPGEKDTTLPLLPKLLRSTRLILSSRSFYFSYDFNITRRMADPKMLLAKPLTHEDIDPLVSNSPVSLLRLFVSNHYSISGIET